MKYEEIRKAITERMVAFEGIAQNRVEYPNQPALFSPPESGVWCRLNIQYAPALMAGMAEKPYTRRPGQVVIQCFARERSGSRELTELADRLEAHFGYWTIGDLECLEASMIPVGRGNGFEQVNVVVRFRAG